MGRRKLYRTVYLDPPWNETGGGRIKRGADRWYELIKTKHDIVRTIYESGVFNPNPKGAHAFVWTTNRFLPDALFIMQALGFRYVTNFSWGKVSENGVIQKGLGQYTFGSHELCLFGVMGRLPAKKRVSTLLLEPRGEKHSEKPDEMRRRIHTMSPGPRLELFGRQPMKGWTVWGKVHRNKPACVLT